jgi:hypothetical protein
VQSGDYLSELKTLADYQRKQRRAVTFRVTITSVDNHAEVTFRAVRADGKTATGAPVLRLGGIGKLALWESFGYIKVVTGSLKQRSSIVRLTDSGLEAAAS